MAYKILSRCYGIVDLIFLFGTKGNPRAGLLEAVDNTPLRILDIGVGTAAGAASLARQNDRNQIIGIDISNEMLAAARRTIARYSLTNLEVRKMPAEALQFSDKSFDVVMTSFALHEFGKTQRETVFREATRVLKPGGAFYILDYARQGSLRNRIFIALSTIIEPPDFTAFLDIDWHTHLDRYGLKLISEQEFSFSKLIIFRREEYELF